MYQKVNGFVNLHEHFLAEIGVGVLLLGRFQGFLAWGDVGGSVD